MAVLAGGMVPSHSAPVVLLGGIALGRAWFGFGLVVVYGIGMALALMATGPVPASQRAPWRSPDPFVGPPGDPPVGACSAGSPRPWGHHHGRP